MLLNEQRFENDRLDSYDGRELVADASQTSLETIIAAQELYGPEG